MYNSGNTTGVKASGYTNFASANVTAMKNAVAIAVLSVAVDAQSSF